MKKKCHALASSTAAWLKAISGSSGASEDAILRWFQWPNKTKGSITTYCRWCRARSGRGTKIGERYHWTAWWFYWTHSERWCKRLQDLRKKQFNKEVRERNSRMIDVLVCASGLDGCKTIDSFHAAMASSNSSTEFPMATIEIQGETYWGDSD